MAAYMGSASHGEVSWHKQVLASPSITLFPVSVVVLFFISWAPFHFQRLGYVYFREHVYFRTVNQYLFYLSGFFYFLSSTLNPILYNVMSAKYRAAFLSWVLCRDPNSPRREDRRGCLTTCATSTSNLLSRSANLKYLLFQQLVSTQ